MPKTSNCPSCQEPITLADVPEASLVECPLCQDQFTLVDALDFVAEPDGEDGPPEVVVVEVREEDELTAEDPAANVRCPCCKEAFSLDALLLAETDEPLGAAAASAILPDGSPRKSDDGGFSLDFGDGPDKKEDHGEFALRTPDEPKPTAAPTAFEFAAAAGAEDADDESRPKRRRREQGGLKDFVGAIVGGAVGLAITYYLLNFFGGPRFDFLDIYLPGVQHTADNWPFEAEEEEFDSGIGDAFTPAAEPVVSKPKKPEPDRKPEKPQPVEEPAPAEPEEPALPADYVGLLAPPAVTSDELGEALKEANRAGNAGPMNARNFDRWCRLAETATFVDRGDGNPRTRNRLDATVRLLKDLEAADIMAIGPLASEHLTDMARPDGGILLAGIVQSANTPSGGGFLTEITMAGTGAMAIVASDSTLPVAAQDRVLLLGYIVDSPSETMQGLATESPRIVWSSTAVKFQ